MLVANNSDELVVDKTADWSIEQRLRGQVSTIRSLTMSPHGAWLASAGDGREIHLWRTSDWSKERPICRHSHGIRKTALTPDGTSLLALDTLGVISAWNLDAGLKTCRLCSQTDGPARQFSLSPDGQWLAVILEDGQVRLRRLPGPDPHEQAGRRPVTLGSESNHRPPAASRPERPRHPGRLTQQS